MQISAEGAPGDYGIRSLHSSGWEKTYCGPNETRAAEFHAGAQNESERLGVKPSEQLGSFRMASENWREITGEHNGKTVRGRFKTDSKGIVTVSSRWHQVRTYRRITCRIFGKATAVRTGSKSRKGYLLSRWPYSTLGKSGKRAPPAFFTNQLDIRGRIS
jgi:hypothetical protein